MNLEFGIWKVELFLIWNEEWGMRGEVALYNSGMETNYEDYEGYEGFIYLSFYNFYYFPEFLVMFVIEWR